MSQLKMYRPAGPCSYEVPKGYRIRSMRPDEGADWCRCCDNGELGIDEISQAFFEKKMLPACRMENIFFIVDENDVPVGTATALVDTERNNRAFLHMVGVDENHRGKGLSYPLCLCVCERHAEMGNGGCYLSTDDFRPAAVKTYLKCGYLPVLYEDDMRERWGRVLKLFGFSVSDAVDDNGEPVEPVFAEK